MMPGQKLLPGPTAQVLSLDPAGAVAAGQFFHLSNGDHIVVTLNGMLQGGSGNRKFYSSLGILAGKQAVDQTATEGIATAYPVDNVQVILLGEAVFILGNIIQHGTPAVIKGTVALTQGNGDHLKAKLVR